VGPVQLGHDDDEQDAEDGEEEEGTNALSSVHHGHQVADRCMDEGTCPSDGCHGLGGGRGGRVGGRESAGIE
jgi:hypothetical protein